MFSAHLRAAALAAALAGLLTAGGAYAVDLALTPGASAVVIEQPVQIKAGERSPVDFPGVKDKPFAPLPKGYVAVGYPVQVTYGGGEYLHPSFVMRCPAGRKLATFAFSGDVGAQIVGPDPFVRRSSFDYVGRRSWAVIIDYNRRTLRAGQTITGTVYALCR